MRIVQATLNVMLSSTTDYYYSFSPFVKLRVTEKNSG